MSIVMILNELHDTEWVSLTKENSWYSVAHYVGNELKRKCRYDDFFEAVECLKEWQSYFEA